MRAAARALVTAACMAALAWAGWQGWQRLPQRWNPWAPLVVADAPNLLTRYKLARLESDPAACLAVLAQTPFHYAPEPPRSAASGCGWDAGVRISATAARLSQPFVLECSAAVTLALWERHSLQARALEHFHVAVARIDHYGSYACRNIGGAAAGRRSEHARANALDIAGFELADGTSVRVAKDWRRADRRGAFLREVHADACRYWNVVLGPDYNAAHRDHFHFDLGPYRACR